MRSSRDFQRQWQDLIKRLVQLTAAHATATPAECQQKWSAAHQLVVSLSSTPDSSAQLSPAAQCTLILDLQVSESPIQIGLQCMCFKCHPSAGYHDAEERHD